MTILIIIPTHSYIGSCIGIANTHTHPKKKAYGHKIHKLDLTKIQKKNQDRICTG